MVSKALVIFGDSTMPRTVVARVPNIGYPEAAPHDALLIAAAPTQHAELLACKQFLEGMHTQSLEWIVAESQKRHAAVCAAIAAATGDKV